jgi:hypothetical protein
MRCLRDLADYTNSLFNKECDPFDMDYSQFHIAVSHFALQIFLQRLCRYV